MSGAVSLNQEAFRFYLIFNKQFQVLSLSIFDNVPLLPAIQDTEQKL